MGVLSVAWNRPLAILSTFRSHIFRTPTFSRRFYAAGGGGKDEKDPTSDSPSPQDPMEDAGEDEFGIDGFDFDVDLDEENLSEVIQKLSEEDDVPETLATDLVDKMVKATTNRLAERTNPRANILSAITPHTVSVLRASRITTNKIIDGGSHFQDHALNKKVTAELHIDQLRLSKPAQAALEHLAGSRLRDGFVKISCYQYPSMEENRARIVTQMDRLVAAAKEAVGENSDQKPLESWDEVRKEVEMQAKEEIEEAGDLNYIVGEAKN